MQSHALPTDRVAASEYKTQIFGVSKGKGKGKGKKGGGCFQSSKAYRNGEVQGFNYHCPEIPSI